MHIAGMSDLHGDLTHHFPECDVAAYVGDFPPLWSTAENWKSRQELDWLKQKGRRWLESNREKAELAAIIVGGNHDLFLADQETREEAIDIFERAGWIVLGYDNPTVTIDGVKFCGYEWTPSIQGRNWAFSIDRGRPEVDESLKAQIHDDVDVVLSHGPPHGLLDGLDTSDRWHVGCAGLSSRLYLTNPSLVMCGHVHEARSMQQEMFTENGGVCRLVNVSMCNRHYIATGAKAAEYFLDT